MILNNSFYKLGATTRDDRQKIVELAENLCQKSKENLMMPEDRLISEINWFPSISPRKISTFIDNLNKDYKSIIYLDEVEGISKINLLETIISNDNFLFSKNELFEIIIQLLKSYKNLKIEDLMKDINQDRIISKFPEIDDFELLKNKIMLKQKLLLLVA